VPGASLFLCNLHNMVRHPLRGLVTALLLSSGRPRWPGVGRFVLPCCGSGGGWSYRPPGCPGRAPVGPPPAGLCLDQWWIQRGIGGLASSFITCLGASALAEDLLLLRPPRPALVAREEAWWLIGVFHPSPGRPWWRGGFRVDAFDPFFFVDSGAVHASVGFSLVRSGAHGGRLELVD
jgi:hypothetical protein